MKQKAHAIPLAGTHRSNYAFAGLALLLLILVFALFSPSLRYNLVDFDDIVFISNNTALHNGLSADGIRQAFSPRNTSGIMYLPLLWISYMIDVEWLGATPAQPWGFHFTNVLLHSLNSVLLFFLLLAFCKKPWRAFFFAALWAIHPLRVESVAWVTDRKDILSGLFGLLCLGAYLRFGAAKARPSPSCATRLPYAAALVFLILGLLAKPALVPIPGALLLLDFWPLQRFEFTFRSLRCAGPRLLAEKLPFVFLAALASFGASAAHTATHALSEAPWSTRLLAVPVHYAFYLAKFAWPRNLTPLYPDLRLSFLLVGLASILLAALTAWAWISCRHRPERLVGWLWFLGFLLPVIGLVRFGIQSIADRYTYLPGIGLSIALVFLLPSHRRSPRSWRWLRPALSVLALAVLSILTLRQLPAWQDATTLTNRVLDIFPTHATALETRAGNLLRATGDFQEADRLLSKALQANPHHWKVQLAKAQCLWALEGPSSAQTFLQGLPLPTPLYTLSNWQRDLARYALMLGQTDNAIRHAEQAMALLPPQDLSQTPILLLAMAAAYEKGDMPLALSYAHQFPPYAAKTSLDLADLLPHYVFQWVAGYRLDTWTYFQRLVQAHPDRPDFLNNIVWGLATADWSPADPQDVLDMATRLCTLVPGPHPGLLDTLAAAQANAGDFDSAVQTMREALALFPDSTDPGLLAFKARLASRLALYEGRQPYREDAFGRMYMTYFGPLSALKDPPP